MRDRIKELLKEALINMHEMVATDHMVDKLSDVIDGMGPKDLSIEMKSRVLGNLNKILNTDFPSENDYGFLLGQFIPNTESEYHVDVNGTSYYKISELFKDSAGDQIWVIVSGNRIASILLKKSVENTDMDVLKDKLGVDYIYPIMNKYFKAPKVKKRKR